MNELDLLIENYFTESFETSDLLRLIEQVMNEEPRINKRAPEAADNGLKIALDTLKAIFKENDTTPEPKTSANTKNRTFFQNTGNAIARDKAMREIQAELRKNGIEMKLDKWYNDTPDTAIIGGSWVIVDKKGEEVRHAIVLKKGSAKGGNEATQFEGNIIVGLYKALGKTGIASTAAKELKETGDIVDDASFQVLADKVAEAINLKSNIEIKDIKSTSGGKIDSRLTQTYLDHLVTSTEPKADISINDEGISVKKLEESQFVSAQGPELAAIFDVAMKANREDEANLFKDIDLFVEQVQRVIGSSTKKHVAKRKEAVDGYLGDLERKIQKATKSRNYEREVAVKADVKGQFQDIRAKFATTDEESGKIDNTPFQKMMNPFLFGQGVTEEQKRLLLTVIGDAGTGTEKAFVDMRDKLKDIVNSEDFKKELVKESITGNGKFTTPQSKAKGMLKWSMKTPENSYLEMFSDDWFKNAASKAKLEIRDRGSGRGGSLRGEFAPEEEVEFTAQETEEINEHAAIIYESMIGDEMLTEGIQDMIASTINVAKKTAQWIKDKAQKVIQIVSSAIAALSGWLKKLANKGFSYLLNAFGIDADESLLVVEI
jgi:hypothetical protein